MFKVLFIIFWITCFHLTGLAQVLTNCSRFRSCSVSSSSNGSTVDYSYFQCGGLCCGGGFSSCLNGGGGTCPSYDCESKCNGTAPNFTGFTHSYFDCNDTLHIDTTSCSGCPPPAPTPTAAPQPTPCLPTFDGGGATSCECNPDDPYCVSPVLVDVAGNGFVLTNAADGVDFDITANGSTLRIAWTIVESDDAWLALDRNGNSMIDNGRELFGNFTPQPDPPAGQERNGFLALAEYDESGLGGNQDRMIDHRDSIFPALRLWQDTNHNGVSEASELHTLSSRGLASIQLDYKLSKKTDEYGNAFRYRARVGDSKGVQLGRWAWDVFLVVGD